MKRIHSIFRYAGIMAIPVYIALTFVSHLHNQAINPLEYWLSDYGNPIANPDGAVFYNTGCVIAALLLAVFYIGMYRWYGRGRAARRFNISYAIAQAAGLFEAVLLIMTTVYPLGANTEMHRIFSTAHMIALDFFLCFTATGFFMNKNIHKGLGVLGFAAAIFNIFTTNTFPDFYLAEWIFFPLFMVYMVLVTKSYDKIRQSGKGVTIGASLK